MVQINSLQRQPTELDYADPTKFKFSINKLPKVEYFTTACNLFKFSINKLPKVEYFTTLI